MSELKKVSSVMSLVKTLLGIVVTALAIYMSLQSYEKTRLKIELAKAIPSLQPLAQSDLSIQVNPKCENTLDVKLHLKVDSVNHLYLYQPKIFLAMKGTNCFYDALALSINNPEYSIPLENVTGMDLKERLLVPNTVYQFNYSVVVDKDIDLDNYDLIFAIRIDTDQTVKNAYALAFKDVDPAYVDIIKLISAKTHTFKQKISYENPDFETFFADALENDSK